MPGQRNFRLPCLSHAFRSAWHPPPAVCMPAAPAHLLPRAGMAPSIAPAQQPLLTPRSFACGVLLVQPGQLAGHHCLHSARDVCHQLPEEAVRRLRLWHHA